MTKKNMTLDEYLRNLGVDADFLRVLWEFVG